MACAGNAAVIAASAADAAARAADGDLSGMPVSASAARLAAQEPKPLTEAEKKLGAEHPDTLQSINNMGDLLARQGKYGEAMDYFNEALGVLSKYYLRKGCLMCYFSIASWKRMFFK